MEEGIIAGIKITFPHYLFDDFVEIGESIDYDEEDAISELLVQVCRLISENIDEIVDYRFLVSDSISEPEIYDEFERLKREEKEKVRENVMINFRYFELTIITVNFDFSFMRMDLNDANTLSNFIKSFENIHSEDLTACEVVLLPLKDDSILHGEPTSETSVDAPERKPDRSGQDKV